MLSFDFVSVRIFSNFPRLPTIQSIRFLLVGPIIWLFVFLGHRDSHSVCPILHLSFLHSFTFFTVYPFVFLFHVPPPILKSLYFTDFLLFSCRKQAFPILSFPFFFSLSFLSSIPFHFRDYLFPLSSSLFDLVIFRSGCLVVQLPLDLSLSVLFLSFPFPLWWFPLLLLLYLSLSSFGAFIFLCFSDLSLSPPNRWFLSLVSKCLSFPISPLSFSIPFCPPA